ncbi:hypothetical protein Q3G72_016318 [Acer saccharum]|nr:hypothetical protein Q3G72_016318 [Acer saccharum]
MITIRMWFTIAMSRTMWFAVEKLICGLFFADFATVIRLRMVIIWPLKVQGCSLWNKLESSPTERQALRQSQAEEISSPDLAMAKGSALLC